MIPTHYDPPIGWREVLGGFSLGVLFSAVFWTLAMVLR
jgi:type III secretory pathway component EscT